MRFTFKQVNTDYILQFFGSFVGGKSIHGVVVPHAILCIIDRELSMVHFMVGNTVFHYSWDHGELNVVGRVIQHRKRRMNVEKQKYRSAMRTRRAIYSCQDSTPCTQDSNQVLNWMLIACV